MTGTDVTCGECIVQMFPTTLKSLTVVVRRTARIGGPTKLFFSRLMLARHNYPALQKISIHVSRFGYVANQLHLWANQPWMNPPREMGIDVTTKHMNFEPIDLCVRPVSARYTEAELFALDTRGFPADVQEWRTTWAADSAELGATYHRNV